MKPFREMVRRVREERGITGLETAIVLIAFVVVAAVFAFVVLSTGLFSSERGKETVYAGLAKTRGSMTLTGGVVAASDGTQIDETDEDGNPIVGDTFFLLFSAQEEAVRFAFPARTPTQEWQRLLDTSDARWSRHVVCESTHYELSPRSIVVFRLAERSTNGGGAA